MASIVLEIQQPAHNATLVGQTTVRLQGRVVTSHPGPLFYKWYSSLNAPTDVSRTALNWNDHQALDFSPALSPGSHILTFTAKDVDGDALADLQQVQTAGMAGGPLDAQSPCIFHLFRAEMVHPQASLSRTNSTLDALAPVKWAAPEYQAINRLRYLWRLTPRGAPAGRSSAEIPQASLTPIAPTIAGDPVLLRFQGALPLGPTDTGSYDLTLRVEDNALGSTVGHEVTRTVTIV